MDSLKSLDMRYEKYQTWLLAQVLALQSVAVSAFFTYIWDGVKEAFWWKSWLTSLEPSSQYHNNQKRWLLWWKITFDGRRHLIEDHFWYQTTFNKRWHLIEDGLWWKITFDGGRHLIEDHFWYQTTFNKRWHLIEDGLWWKTSFDRRRPLIEEDTWCYMQIFNWSLTLKTKSSLQICSILISIEYMLEWKERFAPVQTRTQRFSNSQVGS